jgi:hypothetical protein
MSFRTGRRISEPLKAMGNRISLPRLPAPEPIDFAAIRKIIGRFGPYLTVDIGTFAFAYIK